MKIKILHFIKFWLPALIWSGLIFFISSGKVPSASHVYWQDFVAKKSAHVFEYAIFTILFFRAFLNSKVERKKAASYAILLAVFYAGTDELHQFFTPGRTPAIRDVVIDSLTAAAIAYWLWGLLPKASDKVKSLAKKANLT